MRRPTRATAAGQAYLDLQNRARAEGRATQELLTLYVVERWLARLSMSPYAEQFIIKGGVLLAAYDARRPTADLDAPRQKCRWLPGEFEIDYETYEPGLEDKPSRAASTGSRIPRPHLGCLPEIHRHPRTLKPLPTSRIRRGRRSAGSTTESRLVAPISLWRRSRPTSESWRVPKMGPAEDDLPPDDLSRIVAPPAAAPSREPDPAHREGT